MLDKISHRPNTGSIIGGPYVEPLYWTGIGWILRSFVRPPCSIFPGRSVQQLLPDLVLLKDCNFVFIEPKSGTTIEDNLVQKYSSCLTFDFCLASF